MSLSVILKNENNGPAIRNGKFVMISGVDAAMQVIDDVLTTQLGEYQYDQTKGVEFFDNAFNANPNYQLFESQIRRQVLALPFVEKVTAFSYEIVDNEINYEITVQTIYGTGSTGS